MCVICDDFRIKKCGTAMITSHRMDFGILGGISVSIEISKHYSQAYLALRLNERMTASVPISYCPVCGKMIGGDKHENMESHLD